MTPNTEMNGSKKRRSFVKYDAAVRVQLLTRTHELASSGLTRQEIRAALQAGGFKAPDGRTPIRTQDITRALTQAAPNAPKRGAIHSHVSTKSMDRLPPTATGILTDPALSDAQKVAMLLAYCNA